MATRATLMLCCGMLAAAIAAGCGASDPIPQPAPAVTETPTTAAGGGAPEPPRFPDPSTTGVPDGVTLEESESLTVDEDGAIIDGLHVTGNIVVEADDVVIRNTKISTRGHIAIRANGTNLLVEDSEIDGRGRANPAVAFSKYTLRRVHIYNAQEGPRIAGGNVTIEDSLIHEMVHEDDNHTDVVQVVSGSNIVIRGNNLQAHDPSGGAFGNAAFMYGEESGPVRDCLVEGNLLNGGNYTVNGGGGGTKDAACEFRGNVFQRDHRYGAAGNLGPGTVWDDTNVWFDTDEPVK